MRNPISSVWKRQYALPPEHGSWIWWIGPLILGGFAGGRWTTALTWLSLAALAAFLSRQPSSILIKTFSGRRPKRDRPPALFWLVLYLILLLIAITQLVRLNQARVLWLAIPALPTLAWHFYLIAQRRERNQMGIELVGTGALALSGPAAYWVCGGMDPAMPWILWSIGWLQSAASITLVYLRLSQREWVGRPAGAESLRRGSRTLIYHSFNFIFGWVLAATPYLSIITGLAFSFMLMDALTAIWRPAIGTRPRQIGLRQLIASSLFYLLMVAAVA